MKYRILYISILNTVKVIFEVNITICRYVEVDIKHKLTYMSTVVICCPHIKLYTYLFGKKVVS